MCGSCQRALFFALSLGLAAAPVAADQPDLDPALAYLAERRDPVTYQVDFSVAVTAPYHTRLLKVWLPIPPSDTAQEFSSGELSTFPTCVEPQLQSEPLYGNRFAYFEFTNPQGAQLIRHTFRIKIWELHWGIEPGRIDKVDNWPSPFAPFLRDECQAVVVNDQLRAVLDEAVPRRAEDYDDLASMFAWVDANFAYDHQHASLAASSMHALANRRGHCSDYHGFCAAMGRALGYPTRVTYGINPFPKNSPSHCKLEVFLPPYGWVSYDVSETQRLQELIRDEQSITQKEREVLLDKVRGRFLRGFRDNTWYLQTRGTDYDLAPPANRKVAVVRTIYAEADGQPLPEPDPAALDAREFSWMTIHKYVPDRSVTYAFQDWRRLREVPVQAD